MFETVSVSVQKSSIDECLSVFGKSKNIGEDTTYPCNELRGQERRGVVSLF